MSHDDLQQPPEALLGEVVAGHRLEAIVGRGGHAVIYRAFDTALERTVALKLIDSAALDADPRLTSRFRVEIDLVKRLEHPNIVRLYAFGVTPDRGQPWMTMELLDGVTLRARLEHSRLTTEQALDLTLQILEGLAVAHEQDIVHCDLKPDNIILVRKGVSRELAKILDFGVGKALTADQTPADTAASATAAATPRYMAPELLLGVPTSPATDVHGVGLLLFEMLAGHAALQGEDTDEILRHIASGAVIELPPHLQDTDLGALLARALAPEPFDRFLDAAEMYAAVEQLIRSQPRSGLTDVRRTLTDLPVVVLPDAPATAAPAQARITPRAVLLGLLVGIVLIGVGAASTWWVVQRDASENTSPSPTPVATAEETPEPPPETPPPPRWRPGDTPRVVAGASQGALQLGAALPDALRISLAPTVDAEVLRTELAPLQRLLANRLRRPIELVVADSYEDQARTLVAREAAFGTFPPMLYVETTRDGDRGLELLAFEAFEGASTSDGYLLVRETSDISLLEDLTDKRFCFTDPSSTTGYALPRHWLRSRGLDPDAIIAEIHWSGSHLQVMRDLVDGRCDVAATYSGAFLSARDNSIAVGRLRIFAITGRSPQNVWLAAPETDPALVDQMRQALLDLDPRRDLDLPRIGDSLRITGFVPATPDTYDTLRAIDAERQALTPSP